MLYFAGKFLSNLFCNLFLSFFAELKKNVPSFLLLGFLYILLTGKTGNFLLVHCAFSNNELITHLGYFWSRLMSCFNFNLSGVLNLLFIVILIQLFHLLLSSQHRKQRVQLFLPLTSQKPSSYGDSNC